MSKCWWARVGDGYGRWIPTGCEVFNDAVDYLNAYYGGWQSQRLGAAFFVNEWLQL